jgi:hypothetical protein
MKEQCRIDLKNYIFYFDNTIKLSVWVALHFDLLIFNLTHSRADRGQLIRLMGPGGASRDIWVPRPIVSHVIARILPHKESERVNNISFFFLPHIAILYYTIPGEGSSNGKNRYLN